MTAPAPHRPENPLGQLRGRFDQLSPWQATVAFVSQRQSGHRARHAGRLMAETDARFIHITLLVQVRVPTGGGGRGFPEIDGFRFAGFCALGQHEAATAQIASLWQGDP